MLKEFKLFVYNKTRVFSFVIAWKPSIILFSCFFFHRFRSFRSIELVDVQMIKISFVLAHRLIDDDRRVYCSSLLFAHCRLDYHFFLFLLRWFFVQSNVSPVACLFATTKHTTATVEMSLQSALYVLFSSFVVFMRFCDDFLEIT